MKFKFIKNTHQVNCRYCKALGHKVQAIWHLTGANLQSCEHHKEILRKVKAESDTPDPEPSEADYQTWMRL